jgi:hypothetical protein
LVIANPPWREPVPASPESWVSAFTICGWEKLKMLAKPGGNAPLPAKKPSIAPATLRTFAGAPGGSSEIRDAGANVRKTSVGS